MKKLLSIITVTFIALFFVGCKSDEQKREDAIREIMNGKIADISSYEIVETNYRDSLMNRPYDYDVIFKTSQLYDSIMDLMPRAQRLQQSFSDDLVKKHLVSIDSLNGSARESLISVMDYQRILYHSFEKISSYIDSKQPQRVKRVRQKYRYNDENGTPKFGIGYYFFDDKNNITKYLLFDEQKALGIDGLIGMSLQRELFVNMLYSYLETCGINGMPRDLYNRLLRLDIPINTLDFSSLITGNNKIGNGLVDYTVHSRKESEYNGIKKVTYTIVIPKEYDKNELDKISDFLKSQESISYVFVEYYLDTQPLNGGNYAISKRSPQEVSTTINYKASPKEDASIKTPYSGCKIYGKWSMYGATLIVYQKNGRTYMVNYYGGNSYGDEELYRKTTYRGRTAFVNADDPDDMYVINANGDLDGYNMGDLATTFSRIE